MSQHSVPHMEFAGASTTTSTLLSPQTQHMTIQMEVESHNTTTSTPLSPQSQPFGLRSTIREAKNTLKVHVRTGYAFMMAASMVLGLYLFIYQLRQLFKINDFDKWSSDGMAPFFITLVLFTNIAMALAFGKPYTGAFLAVLVFAVLMSVCIRMPGLWDWTEKLLSTIVPFVFGCQYYWIGWVRRNRME